VSKQPTSTTIEHNPLCGDVIRLDLKIKQNTLTEVGFMGRGCAISQASASMLTDYIVGKKIPTLKKINPTSIYKLLGVTISPGRINCALLGLKALQKGLK
jgi:nitrogen fixation NifU-like protein